MSYLDTIKNVGTVVSCCIGCISLAGIIIKPLRRKAISFIVKNSNVDQVNTSFADFRAEMNEKYTYIGDVVQEIKQQNEDQAREIQKLADKISKTSEGSRASLGNSIKHIYYQYSAQQQLPIHEREALVTLHEAYKALGGNHYVDDLFDEMKNWQNTL